MVSRRFPRKAKKRKPAWQDGRVLCHVATELGSDLLRQLLWDDHISEKSRKCLVSNFVEMFRMEFNQSNNGQSSKPLSVWPSKNLGVDQQTNTWISLTRIFIMDKNFDTRPKISPFPICLCHSPIPTTRLPFTYFHLPARSYHSPYTTDFPSVLVSARHRVASRDFSAARGRIFYARLEPRVR